MAQRNRIGANFHQIPVNQPKAPVNTYMFDGPMAWVKAELKNRFAAGNHPCVRPLIACQTM